MLLNKPDTAARVHRFGDRVAVHLGTGETVYLSPSNAGKLARAISAAARDCEREPTFSQSTFSTVSIHIGKEG